MPLDTDDTTPSLGETLAAALAQQEATPTSVPPAGADKGADPLLSSGKEGAPAPAEPGQRTDGRDAFGRFQPKGGDPAVPAAPADPAAPGAVVPGATPAPAAPAAAEAPASWRDDMKPLYGALPEPVKAYMHQREQELQTGFQKVAQRAGIAEAVLGEFAPYAAILESEKASPVDAIRTLLQTAHALRTGGPEYKKAIILSMVQQYGVDMSTELNPQQAKTEAELATLTTEKMYGTARTQGEFAQQVQTEYEAFANDPKNEFFPQVRQIMGGLVGQGYAKNLAEAYQMAIGMHPEVRQRIWDREKAALVEAPRRRAAANMSVSGAPNSGRAVPVGKQAQGGGPDNSIRASIEAALDEK